MLQGCGCREAKGAGDGAAQRRRRARAQGKLERRLFRMSCNMHHSLLPPIPPNTQLHLHMLRDGRTLCTLLTAPHCKLPSVPNPQTGGARQAGGGHDEYKPSAAIARRMPSKWPRPVWHAPWKLYRVISGHLG